MNKAEYKWKINSTEYHLQRKHIELGNGVRSFREVWELSSRIGDRWDAKWTQKSNRSVGATRDEMLALLADMFNREPAEMEPFIVAAEKAAEDHEEAPVRRRIDAPDLGRKGIPTRPLPERI